VKWPNKPDAPNPATASRFQFPSHRRGLGDPERWAKTLLHEIIITIMNIKQEGKGRCPKCGKQIEFRLFAPEYGEGVFFWKCFSCGAEETTKFTRSSFLRYRKRWQAHSSKMNGESSRAVIGDNSHGCTWAL